MTTATAKPPKNKTNGHADVNHFAGGYHDVNKTALARATAIMAGTPDPGPLMTLEDDEADGADDALLPSGEGGRRPDEGPHGRKTGVNRQPAPSPQPSPKGRGGRTATPVASDDAHLAATHARELIPIEHLTPSPFQPRKDFDSAKLEELAASMKAHGGNHTDLIVRLAGVPPSGGRKGEHRLKAELQLYEIIAGERRWRAAAIAKLPAVWCVVLELDDTAARRLCRRENLQREDLTDIERVTAYRDMLRDGDYPTQQALAESLGITPATLSNQLRVLDLPKEWLDLVSQEKLTLTHLRSLATWADRPRVLQRLSENVLGPVADCLDWDINVGFTDQHERPPTVKEFDIAVLEAVAEASRPVDAIKSYKTVKDFDGKRVKILPEDIPLPSSIKSDNGTLAVIDVKGLGRRAFNIDFWNALSQHAKAQRAKKKGAAASGQGSDDDQHDASASGRKPAKVSAADQRHRDEQAKKRHQRDLYTYRIEWLQAKIAERLNDAPLQVLVWHLLALAAGIRRPSSDHTTESWLSDQFGEAAIAAGGSQKGKHHATDEWKTLKTLMRAGEPGGISPRTKTNAPKSPVADAHRLADSSDAKSDPTAMLRETLQRWYGCDLKRWARPIDEEFIEAAADDLAIDFAKEWRLTRTFLERLSKEQLGELWIEWKLPMLVKKPGSKQSGEYFNRDTGTCGEVIDAIIEHFDAANAELKPNCPLPKCLAKLKPCSITR